MPTIRLLLVTFLCCISLNANAELPFMSEKASWDEEVLLANGQLLSVHREVTYGSDGYGRSGQGRIKEQSIHFSVNNKKVEWKNNDEWPISYMPDILDIVGDMPVLIMPVSRPGPCTKYDFPQEGLVAFTYQNGDWKRISLAELPANLKVNLLRNVHAVRYWNEYKGKIITPQDKLKLETGSAWGATTPGQSILEAGKFYAVADNESCARLHPLPNPQLDEAAEKNLKTEIKAPILTAQVKYSSNTPLTISPDEYRKVKGKWSKSAYISNSCEKIVDGVDSMELYQPHNVSGTSHSTSMVGSKILLKNGNQIPIKRSVKSGQSPALVNEVVCSDNVIIAIKRRNKEELVILRFTQTGNIVDAFQVVLSDISQYFPGKDWPGIWNIQAIKEDLTITLGNYSYKTTADSGGVIEQQATYTVKMP